MISSERAIELALALPGAYMQDHFNRPSFRINKKIFATFHQDTQRFVLKLSPVDQSVFVDFDNEVFYPVTGGWGKQGWTFTELSKVREDMFGDALRTAWKTVSDKTKR